MSNTTPYRLFLDDERFPADDGWIIVRSFDEAVSTITRMGIPTHISFDHDLGSDKTGMDVAKWLCDHALDNNFDLSSMTYYVHSQNPVGRDNIQFYLDNFKKVTREKGVDD
jgi:hypothetical protein